MAHASWGPGYPDCQYDKWVLVAPWRYVPELQGISFGRARQEVADLAERLIAESYRRGYRFKNRQCWGAVCRAIRGTTDVPSNHSWGLALDFNSAYNYLGRSDGGDIPGWMVDLWADYGWRWGGTYSNRPDPMHFEFMLSVAEAGRASTRARRAGLGEDQMTEEEKARLKDVEVGLKFVRAYVDGMERRCKGEPEPSRPGPKRLGWRNANKFLTQPGPEGA